MPSKQFLFSVSFQLEGFESIPISLSPSRIFTSSLGWMDNARHVLRLACLSATQSIAERCIPREILSLTLTQFIGSGSVAEVYVDERYGIIAKVAFSEPSRAALRHEASIIGSHLMSCSSVPRCYGLYEASGLSLLIMEYAGAEINWDELCIAEK